MDDQQPLVDAFLTTYFPTAQPADLDPDEEAVVAECLAIVARRFSRQKYVLGLAIDFAVVAQQLSDLDEEAKAFRPQLDYAALESRYQIVRARGEQAANTLTLRYGGAQFGIRRIEERVLALFNALGRPSYPSAYVYNTGMWHKAENEGLLVRCFQLSTQGRLALCRRAIEYGLQHLPQNDFFVRPVKRVRLFEQVLMDYPRTKTQHENAGVVFQALAYGYVAAQYPHLDLIADKVRTGSARQRRFGDVDGYQGLDLELSVEVKDLEITSDNLEKQLGPFIQAVRGADLVPLAFILASTTKVREQLEAAGLRVVTQDDVRYEVQGWDWHKQNRAVQGVLHQLAHVEQSPHAVRRLLTFIATRDPTYDALVYHSPEGGADGEDEQEG